MLTSPSTNGDVDLHEHAEAGHAGDGAVELVADAIAHEERAVEVDHLALDLHRAPLGERRLGRHLLQRLASGGARAGGLTARRLARRRPARLEQAVDDQIRDSGGSAT